MTNYEFRVGEALVISAPAPSGRFEIVFEDDGETGYVYAVERRRLRRNRILDALHIYDVESIRDADKMHRLAVHWSDEGNCAAVAINEYLHAAVDFIARRAGCRNESPRTTAWCRSSHAWDDALVGFLTPAS